MRPAVLLLPALLLSGCIRVSWERVHVDEPVQDDRLAGLTPGTADLGACLAALGAPTRVWEDADRGVALAYGWLDETDWGFSVSYNVWRFLSASFSWRDITQRMRGVVLLFDESLTLRDVKRGMLADIAPQVRRRPDAGEDVQ